MPHHPLPINRLYLASQLSEPGFGAPDTLFYVRLADGKRSIVRQSLSTGLAEPVTAEPLPAGGVGYGNALFAVQGTFLVYAAKDNRLHGLDLTTGEQWPITPAYEGVAAPAISPCGQFVACLCEQSGRCNVILTDIRGQTLPVKISADPWYAFNPVFSPDGARLAWQEWDEADMPWDAARLQIATLARPTSAAAAAYELLPVKIRPLGQARVSYGSPQFSPDGQWLAYTSDETGWRSLWVAGVDGTNPVRIDTGEGEVGGPDWTPGDAAMRWNETSQVLYAVRHHHSRDTLLEIAWPAQTVYELPTGWTDFGPLALKGDTLAFVAAHPARPAALVTLDLKTRQESLRATTAIGLFDAGSLSTPEVLSWPTTGGAVCWGILYRAVGPEAEPGPRPLIVYVHGGPTGEMPLTWHAQAQYFASRGWHYLCINHRGSTGFGRAYQDLLQGQWGVADVEDAHSGAAHLVERGLADAQRLIITGGSAGGYTTLMALTQHPDFWAAGVSLYGVGDLYELRRGSHRFEVNYEQRLVGRLPGAGLLWKERSPLTHVKNVRAPVLLFHGTDDKAVPHQQSVDFADAVRRQGGIAELVSYAGEGHGFLKEANRKDQIETMERFLDKYVACRQG
jgi:dipeptidyl aminopeptidase/acylaminoacyl peptidase